MKEGTPANFFFVSHLVYCYKLHTQTFIKDFIHHLLLRILMQVYVSVFINISICIKWKGPVLRIKTKKNASLNSENSAIKLSGSLKNLNSFMRGFVFETSFLLAFAYTSPGNQS